MIFPVFFFCTLLYLLGCYIFLETNLIILFIRNSKFRNVRKRQSKIQWFYFQEWELYMELRVGSSLERVS